MKKNNIDNKFNIKAFEGLTFPHPNDTSISVDISSDKELFDVISKQVMLLYWDENFEFINTVYDLSQIENEQEWKYAFKNFAKGIEKFNLNSNMFNYFKEESEKNNSEIEKAKIIEKLDEGKQFIWDMFLMNLTQPTSMSKALLDFYNEKEFKKYATSKEYEHIIEKIKDPQEFSDRIAKLVKDKSLVPTDFFPIFLHKLARDENISNAAYGDCLRITAFMLGSEKQVPTYLKKTIPVLPVNKQKEVLASIQEYYNQLIFSLERQKSVLNSSVLNPNDSPTLKVRNKARNEILTKLNEITRKQKDSQDEEANEFEHVLDVLPQLMQDIVFLEKHLKHADVKLERPKSAARKSGGGVGRSNIFSRGRSEPVEVRDTSPEKSPRLDRKDKDKKRTTSKSPPR